MQRLTALTIALIPCWMAIAVGAIAAPLHGLTPSQVQRLSRDLSYSEFQDFFQQGQRKLDREVDLLTNRQNFLTGEVLKVSQDLKIQQDLSQFERPPLGTPSLPNSPPIQK